MKILSNSQVGKTTPLSSDSMPDEDRPSSAAVTRRLSPTWNGVEADRSLHRCRSDPLDRHINIATNKLQLGCRIRQNEKNNDVDKQFPDFVDDYRRISERLHGRHSESLMCLENGYHPDIENEYFISNRENGHSLPPLPWLPGYRMPSLPHIREYRKSLSVRLGSLKWSLDLVMVVKSRSTPKPRLMNKSSGKPSSRARKIFSSSVQEKILRTQSCIDLQRVGGENNY